MPDKFTPSIPPSVAKTFPSDPFEAWLAQQALQGYPRLWLQRNKPALRKRWEENPESQLPPFTPSRASAVKDRYEELP